MDFKLTASVDSISLEKLKDYIPLKDWKNIKEISRKRATIVAQTHNHTIKLLGLDSKRFVTDPEYFIKAQLLTSAYYGFDMPCIDYDFYNIEAEALGQEMIYSEGLLPEVNAKKPLIAEKKDLYKLKPDVRKDKARYDFVLGVIQLFKSIFKVNPKLRFCGPYSIAVSLRGYKNLMIDMEDDKGFAKDLFEFIADEMIVPWIQLQRNELGDPSALAAGIEATATFPNVSTSTMDDWILPYYHYTNEKLKNITFTTCCGGISYFDNPEDFFRYQLATCPGIIKGYQWDIESRGFEPFNNYARKTGFPLRLAISAQTILSLKKDEVPGLIDKYLKEGGAGLESYSIFLSDIDPETRPEIVSHLVKTVKEMGGFNNIDFS